MGFWHTGYMEFHEPVGLENCRIGKPRPVVYRCDLCHACFSRSEDLRTHRFERHPLKRPVLMVREHEIGEKPLRITRALRVSDIYTLHATTVEVNGISITIEDLPNHLASFKQPSAEIKLGDTETSASFIIHFDIALQSDITGLEEKFHEIASRGRLDRRAIDDFIRTAKKHPSAIAYCDGICEYLHGMLTKERSPESSLPYEEYREKLNRSADALRDIDRPLAATILGLVAFNFNLFAVAADVAPSSRIGIASARLLRWLGGDLGGITNPIDEPLEKLDRALTDLHTEMLVERILDTPAVMLEHASELESLILNGFSEYDAMKGRVILTVAYAASGRISDARRHVRDLSHLEVRGLQPGKLLKVIT